MSPAQNVTTWHNDNNRTGWQNNESTLTTDPNKPGLVNQSTFGLLQQWSVAGYVFAQPLAIASVPTQFSNCNPSCDMVFVATEQDRLYAFKAAGPTPTPTPRSGVWT